MQMKKYVFACFVLLLVSVRAVAVFDEENLARTLAGLRSELEQELGKRSIFEETIDEREKSQHRDLLAIQEKCNKLSLVLYSQNQDYTFDLTYALHEATTEYKEFNKNRLPYDRILSDLDFEIERYLRLKESIGELPQEQTFQSDRDSCISYIESILKFYSDSRSRIVADSVHYENVGSRLKESYDYAQSRYKILQEKIFTDRQTPYVALLKKLSAHWKYAIEDARIKYGQKIALDGRKVESGWQGVFHFLALMLVFLALATILSRLGITLLGRYGKLSGEVLSGFDKNLLTLLCGTVIFVITNGIGYVVTGNNFYKLATGQMVVLSWLLAAIEASVMARNKHKGAMEGLYLFLPTIVLGIVIIICRIIFIPNSLMNLMFPPALSAVFIWQAVICIKHGSNASDADKYMSWASLLVLLVVTVMSWIGSMLLGMQVLIWWLFQVAAIETVMVVKLLFERYEHSLVAKKNDDKSPVVVLENSDEEVKGRYIRITWLADFLLIAVVPIISILSVPISLYYALNVFDLNDIYQMIISTAFFDFVDADGNEIFKLSGWMIILAASLFFFFRYLDYLSRSMYRDIRFRSIAKRSGKPFVNANEVNLSLADKVISVLVWSIYVIFVLQLLKIPTGAMSVVAAGLAAGLGLAMKDVLNNFICGIQLMSGRLRVGDWVECDGVRGKVTAISNQSTQIETSNGAVMSFLNTALFNYNFKNLTRNNDYELVKITVGVAYGTDLEKVRELILEVLKTLQTKDAFNREVVDTKSGVSVVLSEFADNAVNITVKQQVLVTERFTYEAKARELIYNTFNNNNISIPFPQRDIHIISDNKNSTFKGPSGKV